MSFWSDPYANSYWYTLCNHSGLLIGRILLSHLIFSVPEYISDQLQGVLWMITSPICLWHIYTFILCISAENSDYNWIAYQKHAEFKEKLYFIYLFFFCKESRLDINATKLQCSMWNSMGKDGVGVGIKDWCLKRVWGERERERLLLIIIWREQRKGIENYRGS